MPIGDPVPRYSSAGGGLDVMSGMSPQVGRRGGTIGPSQRREGRNAGNGGEHSHYYRRRMGPPVREHVGLHSWDEPPLGARFYPGYIPEIVITRNQHNYTIPTFKPRNKRFEIDGVDLFHNFPHASHTINFGSLDL